MDILENKWCQLSVGLVTLFGKSFMDPWKVETGENRYPSGFVHLFYHSWRSEKHMWDHVSVRGGRLCSVSHPLTSGKQRWDQRSVRGGWICLVSHSWLSGKQRWRQVFVTGGRLFGYSWTSKKQSLDQVSVRDGCLCFVCHLLTSVKQIRENVCFAIVHGHLRSRVGYKSFDYLKCASLASRKNSSTKAGYSQIKY